MAELHKAEIAELGGEVAGVCAAALEQHVSRLRVQAQL